MGGKRYELAHAIDKYSVGAHDQSVNTVVDERRESIFDLARSGNIQDSESNAERMRNNLQFSGFGFPIALVCGVHKMCK
jgi:hypothetical protein